MHYAQLIHDIVVNVIVADADFIATQTDKTYVLCKRGGIGWKYDGTNFIAPKPYLSWILNKNFDWQPPTPKPEGNYYWNEKLKTWVEND